MTFASFGREFRACVAIARQAYLMRAHGGHNAFSWGLLLAALLLGVPTWFVSDKAAEVLRITACIPLGFLAILWWSYLIGAIHEQNHAAGHALIPRMRGRSLAVLLAGWAVLSVAVGAPLGYATNAYIAPVLLTGLVLGALAAFAFSPVLVWFIGVLWAALYVLGRFMPSGSLTITLGDAGITSCALALLVLCAVMIARGLGRGRVPGIKFGGSPMPAMPVYGSSLRRDCASGDRPALLMQTLGPGANMTSWLIYAALAIALLMAACKLVSMPLPVLRVFVISAALASQFMAAGRLAAAIYARHKEQSLLRLTAFAPAAPGLNLALAGGLLRAFGGYWVVSTALTIVLALMLGAEPGFLASLLVVMCMPAMAAGMLLRDFARKEHYGFAEKAVAAVWYLLTFAMLFMALLGKLGAAWWVAIACAIVLAGSMLVRWRKQAMLRAPAGFPAGRMP